MVKFLWDNCILHEFVRYIYLEKNFNIISSPYLTYQKANKMVNQHFLEDLNRINTARYKIEEKFELIHYIYSLFFSKIYNRTNNFGIKKKNNFYFYFATWKDRKTASTSEILKQLSQSVASQVTHEVLSFAKDYS